MRFIEIACSFGLVIMFHFNHFRNLADAENRFFLHWSSDYAIKFIFFLCLHTLLIYLSYLIIKKIKPVLVKPVFLFISSYLFLYSLCGIFAPPIDLQVTENQLNGRWVWPYLIPFLIVGLHLRFKSRKFFGATKFVVLIWAAIGLSLSISLFLYPYRGHRIDKIENVKDIPTSKSQPPVFIFLFDNWSGPRLLKGLRGNKFPILAALIYESNYFTKADSPASATLRSLPGIIFQNPGRITPDTKAGVYHDSISNKNTLQMESLFTMFKNEGYYTALAGEYHPYSLMINENDLDFLSSHPPYGSNFLTATLFILNSSLQYAADPIIRNLAEPIMRFISTRNKYFRDKKMLDDVYYATRRWDGAVFAFFHILVPHTPLIYEQDGRLSSDQTGSLFANEKGKKVYVPSLSEDYAKTLKYVDMVVGNIINNLISNQMFDKSMLVFLSDHNFKWDPDWERGEDETDVPLIVKYPYNEKGKIIKEQVYLHSILEPLLKTMINNSKRHTDAKDS